MKNTKVIMTIVAVAVLMAGCGSTSENDSSEAATTTTAVTEAETTTTTAAEEAEPETDEETSETEEDPFGDEYRESTERLIPVTYEGDFEYDGVTFKTLADVFAVAGDDPNVGSSGNQFICVIENDDICARFIANMPADMTQQLYDLDIFDDDYKQKELDLVKDLEIARVDDLKAGVPAQEELDKYNGFTVSELADAGFEMNGWSVVGTEGEFTFDNGFYEYAVTFNEPLSEDTDYNETGATDGLTVKSVTYSQLSYNAFNTDDLFE